MISFAGMMPGQFGHVKCTSCTDRFTAEHEEQSIERGGKILAALAVPTVRKIDVEFLARARKKDELFLLLHRVTQWLENAGQDKLVLDHDRSSYYKARCSKIDPPVFKGTSARINVTFTCEDYRRFRMYDDQPVDGMDPPSDNFTFDGRHCLNDFGCMFVLNQMTGTPKTDISKYEISGLPGTLRYEDQDLALKEGSIKGTLYFVNRAQDGALMTGSEVAQRMHDVASWLVLAGRAKLCFDADVTRCYEAEIENDATFDRSGWENGKLALTLTTQPLAIDIQESSAQQTFSLEANTAQRMELSSAFPRGMGYVTPLVLFIQNVGNDAITDLQITYLDRFGAKRDVVFSGGGFRIDVGQTLVVDGEQMTVQIDGQNAISGMASGDFPSVSPAPGEAAIWIRSENAASLAVEIHVRARWV